jgi:hypothetical protein
MSNLIFKIIGLIIVELKLEKIKNLISNYFCLVNKLLIKTIQSFNF